MAMSMRLKYGYTYACVYDYIFMRLSMVILTYVCMNDYMSMCLSMVIQMYVCKIICLSI